LQEVSRGGTVEILEYLHRKLDAHFLGLWDQRQRLEPASPVFALEHDLSDTDLELLETTVRSAVAQGFGARFRQWWLPFVVYATESGYDYVGDEYWPTFEGSTPGWRTHGDRDRIRGWFRKFAADYGGIVPKGAFADNFPIIAWPITHAVLPTYLQRNLAHLLFEFSSGFTTDLLHDPEALGARLAARAGSYTERFRVFCENTTLLGQVAAALLSGDDHESPYLVRSTLVRLVDGLSRERQSRLWLASARHSASRVRSSGFRVEAKKTSSSPRSERLPAATDPKLLLRFQGGGWRAYAQLPNLSALHGRLPHVYDELRAFQARVAGVDGAKLARGRLLFSGQEVRLTSWPRPDTPFVQLERGSGPVNQLIAEQCVVSRGPGWLFRRRDSGLALEVKGRVVHPGRSYVLVVDETIAPPDTAWASETTIHILGVRAFDLVIPPALSEDDTAALVAAGVSVVSDVAVRPIGLVASAWDGEGSVEWLVGEPGLIGVHAERMPETCVVAVDGQRHAMAWPEGERELFLSLTDLTVGTHELAVTLLGAPEQPLAEGTLVVNIRDPEVATEGASSGEGIRLLASPARPTLSDLWDGRATISVDGPPNIGADLAVILRSVDDSVLAKLQRPIQLPMTSDAWVGIAKRVRREHRFLNAYDEAESSEIVVSRSGIGFARLTCDRGFQPLRWRVIRRHDGSHSARLLDRTDGKDTRVEMFLVEAPANAVACPADADIAIPPEGGLLRATAGEPQAAIILPTDPNKLWNMSAVRSFVQTGGLSGREVMRLARAHHAWSEADLPADPFAMRQRDVAQEAITRALISLVAGRHWASLERTLENADDLSEYLDDMQKCVGESEGQKALAAQIGVHLWSWLTPETLLPGFAETMETAFKSSGLRGRPGVARFLLTLAGRPGYIADWDAAERDKLLELVIDSPVLLRAARYAVLGTRALNEAQTAAEGF
jgi:hypothetical protein